MRALRVAVALSLALTASATKLVHAAMEGTEEELFNEQQQQQRNHALWLELYASNGGHKGFNLLYLIPILIGALLVVALATWLIVRKCRNKKKLKRSESALLPIIDPSALLLSPDSRNVYLQDEAETNRQLREVPQDSSDFASSLRFSESLMMSLRFDSTTAAAGGGGAMESFHSSRGGDTSAALATSTSSGLIDTFHNKKSKNQDQSITDAQSTQLYRILHADPNVSSHRLAYQKIAFERMLSSRSSPSGSSCKTWLCQYEGEEIAVKVLQQQHSATASGREMKSPSLSPMNESDTRYEDLRRLVDEIQLTASLEHPNIVRFLAVAWDSMAIESLGLITEYLPEGDLQTHLQVTRYPTWTHRKLRFAIGVANALEYLHSRKAPAPSSSSGNSSSSATAMTTSVLPTKVLHRDVRAKNVGLSHTFEPKLVNIGAKHDYLSLSPELVAAGDGNAFWTAPEVLTGRKYSEKSDIYAFGVLLSEIDTNGTLPYSNTTEADKQQQQQQLRPFQVLNLVASGKLRPSFAPNCPIRIREIAAMCLCNDPAQRVNAATLTQLLESYDKTLAQ